MIDSKTISAVMQGNSQAFEKVYMQTHDKAYSIAYRVLKDDYEAEDIVQDAYLKMIEQVGQLQNPERFESWFYRIVQNAALDNLRKRHADTFSSFENEESDFSFSDTLVSDYTPFDPEASADYAELKRIMNDFVMELPEMQRKCILLRFRGDKKISEIAQILGIPESTVKSNLNYGKKKIEGEVRALEKQGVKLYSLSPLTVIAFLRWIWGKSAISAFSAGVGSAGAATATTAAVSATAGGTSSSSAAAGSAAAGTAAKTGAAIGVKQIIAGVCATVVVGGSAAGVLLQHDSQLEKMVTVQSEGIYEDFVPRSYCLPQISDTEHDWSEMNHQLQLWYDEWESAWDYHCNHQEELKQSISNYDGGQFYRELLNGEHPDYTTCRYDFYLAPPFLDVETGKCFWSGMGNYYATIPKPTREEAENILKYDPYYHSYNIGTGNPVTHEDMMRYLGVSEEQYIQMLHDSLDEYFDEWIADAQEIGYSMIPQLERQREIGHSLIGSDTFCWKFPGIRLVNDYFILELFDDMWFESTLKEMMNPGMYPENIGAEHNPIYISFGKTGITEAAHFEYGKTNFTTGSNIQMNLY